MAKINVRRVHLCWKAGNTVWFHMASDTMQLCNGFPISSYTCIQPFFNLEGQQRYLGDSSMGCASWRLGYSTTLIHRIQRQWHCQWRM